MAPHINLWMASRGVNIGLSTRLYFADETAANAADPVLNIIDPPPRRATLLAHRSQRDGAVVYTFDIYLQGPERPCFSTFSVMGVCVRAGARHVPGNRQTRSQSSSLSPVYPDRFRARWITRLLPVTPAEQVASTHAAFEAGATLVHISVPWSTTRPRPAIQRGSRRCKRACVNIAPA